MIPPLEPETLVYAALLIGGWLLIVASVLFVVIRWLEEE